MRKFTNINNRNELADFLSIQRKTLTYLLYIEGIDDFYDEFYVPKKNFGFRKIKAPKTKLKYVQKKLAVALLNYQKEISENKKFIFKLSHGFEKGKSIITNAKVHRNKRYVINFDLEDFFDSFHFGRVKGFFEKNKYFKLSEEVALCIAQLTCYKGTLPQGAPTSPVITNLIAPILDFRLLKIAKKYKLDYTRYADDLTFSTNNIHFLDIKDEFCDELTKEINKAGFKLNDNKTRLQFKDSRQIVTGLVVNKKINIERNFYKKTRAMAHSLYQNGEFFIDGKKGTMKQLEGRFSFIDSIDKYNNKVDDIKHSSSNLNGREKEYKKFLFYKYFFMNDLPLIVTEGKTDIIYIKAALKKLCTKYPQLIEEDDNKYNFMLSFFEHSKRFRYLFGMSQDGADTIKNIYNCYVDGKNEDIRFPNYFKILSVLCNVKPHNPVILIFDNEIINREKPLYKFFNSIKFENNEIKEQLKEKLIRENWIKLPLQVKKDNNNEKRIKELNNDNNLFLMTVPIINGKTECEIEDLFNKKTLEIKIKGKSLDRTGKKDRDKFYTKDEFSRYIMEHYDKIDFSGFEKLLDIIDAILKEYKKENVQ